MRPSDETSQLLATPLSSVCSVCVSRPQRIRYSCGEDLVGKVRPPDERVQTVGCEPCVPILTTTLPASAGALAAGVGLAAVARDEMMPPAKAAAAAAAPIRRTTRRDRVCSFHAHSLVLGLCPGSPTRLPRVLPSVARAALRATEGTSNSCQPCVMRPARLAHLIAGVRPGVPPARQVPLSRSTSASMVGQGRAANQSFTLLTLDHLALSSPPLRRVAA